MGAAFVISDRQFAHLFPSTWAQLMPRAGDVLRYLNEKAARFASPVIMDVGPYRRAYVSDVAFRLAERSLADGLEPTALTDLTSLNAIEMASRDYILRLSGGRALVVPLLDYEWEAAKHEANNLYLFCDGLSAEGVAFRPSFKGCGQVPSCEGDVISGAVLWEVKSRSKSFEVADLRQAMVYATLDYVAGSNRLHGIGLINPFLGLYIQMDLDKLCLDAAGTSRGRLLGLIAEAMETLGTKADLL